MPSAHDIGVVVIGRNEGERLASSLRSALAACPRVVYVDSASSDGSVRLAQDLGVDVVTLPPPGLTAARGRQAGLEHLTRRYPEVEVVQFIDGDCELIPGWLDAALAEISRDERIAAVSGVRSEARTAESMWSRLVDIEWSRAEGDVLYPGGDSVCRVTALHAVGGWTVGLIAGEDPDLGFRLLDAGWRVRRLRVPMTRHDIRITRFGQYWRRAVRSGFAYAAAGWRNRNGAGRAYFARGLKFTAQAVMLTLLTLASVFIWPALIAAGIIAAWICWRAGCFARRAGLSPRDTAWYAALAIPVRCAQARGFLSCFVTRAFGARAELIEYRGTLAEKSA